MHDALDHRRMAEISSCYTEVLSPTSPDQLRTVGKVMGLSDHSAVIDFACGYAEALRIWAREFGIRGTGIDSHGFLCRRARLRVDEEGLHDRVRVIEADGTSWGSGFREFDVAACIGAEWMWGGFGPAISSLERFVRVGGRILIGAAFYHTKDVPQELLEYEGELATPEEMLATIRAQGCELEYMTRSGSAEWERYVCSGWHDLLRWLEDNPSTPERSAIMDAFYRGQDMYVKYRSEYQGFALYILRLVPGRQRIESSA